MNDLVLSVSDFVALLNQTLEFAYPSVVVTGELANFRVSKNRWVYFDLKDELATVKFFGTVYQLPGPLEDGLLLTVRAQPRLHAQYGFSLNIMNIQLAGEGSLKRAAQLLQAKLAAEGLFDEARKRPLPYPPTHVGLITSSESAAYADFIKILNQRWLGTTISLADVHVQGEAAPAQIIEAIEFFNQHANPPEVLVIIRGGGSAEDLAAFSTEPVTRAIAGSRIPTLLAIGHEIDLSLAELAADKRASTPSNAAELLVPDKASEKQHLVASQTNLKQLLTHAIMLKQRQLSEQHGHLKESVGHLLARFQQQVMYRRQLLEVLSPQQALQRGFAIVRRKGQLVRSGKQLTTGHEVVIELSDASASATIGKVTLQ